MPVTTTKKPAATAKKASASKALSAANVTPASKAPAAKPSRTPKTWGAAAKAAQGSKKLIVFGHGETEGRKLQGLRIRETLLARLAEVAGGPLYLLVELAIENFVSELHRSKGVQVVDATSLND